MSIGNLVFRLKKSGCTDEEERISDINFKEETVAHTVNRLPESRFNGWKPGIKVYHDGRMLNMDDTWETNQVPVDATVELDITYKLAKVNVIKEEVPDGSVKDKAYFDKKFGTGVWDAGSRAHRNKGVWEVRLPMIRNAPFKTIGKAKAAYALYQGGKSIGDGALQPPRRSKRLPSARPAVSYSPPGASTSAPRKTYTCRFCNTAHAKDGPGSAPCKRGKPDCVARAPRAGCKRALPQPFAGTPATNAFAALERLVELKKQGMLTEVEFAKMKKQIPGM